MKKVLVSSEQTLIRDGCAEAALTVPTVGDVDKASSRPETLSRIQEERYDAVVMGMRLPTVRGTKLLEEVKAASPDLPTLGLGPAPAELYGKRVIQAGGSGYLLWKNATVEKIKEAIQHSLDGDLYITPQVGRALAVNFEGSGSKALPYGTLSRREFQVAYLIAIGNSNRSIASELGICAKTVSTYRARILKKLDLRNNVEVAHHALYHGIIEGPGVVLNNASVSL